MGEPLTHRQREILDFLLSVDMPGVDDLRRQAEFAESAGPWAECCPSISLSIDRERAPQSSIRRSPAIEAWSRERDDPECLFDLLIFLDEGWLSTIELVHYGESDTGLSEFPPPDDFSPPFAYNPPA